ncbi:MAG: hypothetical protein KDB14_12965 [Planctomycetales bacterium]|nr:hypothetical protein [Planctomycetales bacterium]
MSDTSAPAKQAGTMDELTTGWDCFWFASGDNLPLQRLRLVAGLSALVYFLAWTPDVGDWLAPGGSLSARAVSELAGTPIARLLLNEGPYAVVPWIGAALAAVWMTGWQARWLAGGVLICILSLVHRAPMLAAPTSALLCPLAFYLAFAPHGRQCVQNSLAGFCLRLIQVHCAAILLVSGLQQLGGSAAWWNGEAFWWLVAHEPQRMVDWSWMARRPILLDLGTHFAAAFPVLGGALVLTPVRPLVLGASIPYCLLMGIITADLLYYALLLGTLWAAFSKSPRHAS